MNKSQIDNLIIEVFNSSFPNNSTEITIHSKPTDVDAWDSLGNMMVINAIEGKFDIKFDLEEMLNFDSVNSIAEAVYTKFK